MSNKAVSAPSETGVLARASDIYLEPVNIPILKPQISGSKVISIAPPYCKCVSFIKWLLGRTDEIWGDAWEIVVDMNLSPQVGDIVCTYEGRGHCALIIKRVGDLITLDEANLIGCTRSQRTIRIDDPIIRGFKRII